MTPSPHVPCAQIMLASRWLVLLVYPYAVGGTECLVGCLVQGISPFDDENIAVWDDRSACDSTTVGCTVTSLYYPSTSFQGALWASTTGTDGSSDCMCNICDPYPYSDTTSYMEEETLLWSRIHCYIAASEASGYDVSPCVAAIVDTGKLPCVDDVYEAPTVDQFDCDENAMRDLSSSASIEECAWDGELREAQEMFPTTYAVASTTSSTSLVNTVECLVGCLVQGISPFDDEGLAVWDNRGTCDSNTIGCEVSAINYPSTFFQGALWASSWGTEGSDSCTCNLCDPYPYSDTTSYMEEETSLWSRIHCYIAASEASGYDVSPCVAAIVDTGTLPCVDDVYEEPTVDQFDCDENAMRDLSSSASIEECAWDGELREAKEMFPTTSAVASTTSSTSLVNTVECLVGCLVQGISPFDDEGLAVWDNRGTCDSNTIGCEVSAIKYPSTLFQGALWASSWGTEGSDSCTCNLCDPYPYSDTTSYMDEETSLWSRIHCYIAASEASGYDVSPCVAAIVDTGTLPCVDDVYEEPTVDQFDCDENAMRDLSSSASIEECAWDGELREAKEMFSNTVTSTSTTSSSALVNTNACLVGCLVQGISPFDEEGLAVWDNRGTCDSNTIGCEVSAINYPSTSFQGALWASSWGTEGSRRCTCNICDPYPYSDTTSYMDEETSLWSRIHCYLVASESSGYDVSPCVAAIVDTGTLPCVDDVYEPPSVDKFDCAENGINDLTDSSSFEECSWTGAPRLTSELFGGTQAPAPLPGPTPAPAPLSTRNVTPEPDAPITASPDAAPGPTPAPAPLTTRNVTPEPDAPITASLDAAPVAPSTTDLPSADTPQPSSSSTSSSASAPMAASPSSSSDSTLLLESEGGAACGVGNTCSDNLCCHPDTSTCGRSK